jgi:type IV pilus assembly protein PilW
VINCIGGTNTSGATQLYVNAFSIDNQGRLVCVFNGAAAVPLVQGLQNLQVSYGVKTDFSVDNRSVDSYLRANEMTATNWSNVISVRITLNFTNPLAGQPGQPATIPFTRVIDLMGQTGVKT